MPPEGEIGEEEDKKTVVAVDAVKVGVEGFLSKATGTGYVCAHHKGNEDSIQHLHRIVLRPI